MIFSELAECEIGHQDESTPSQLRVILEERHKLCKGWDEVCTDYNSLVTVLVERKWMEETNDSLEAWV